ncbi:MAG: hypothetical protein IPG59_02435 [Candidatus Melainabacteria bacterium]|nr:MAG: hypothetical protein IPG59_02435 [Candidatus Melainabacteria bacterium]
MQIRNRSIEISCLLFLVTLVPVEASAQEVQPDSSSSVYEASTVAAEKPVVKSLTAEEFSAYANEICKKYEFDGPKQVNSSTDQTELYQKLTEARKLLFTRLCDPEVRKDSVLKEKLQSQMKSLTEDLRSFPELAGFGKVVVPPSLKLKKLGRSVGDFPPIDEVPVTKDLSLPDDDFVKRKPPGRNSRYAGGAMAGKCDPLPATREQIKLKHGENYIK